MSDKAAFQKARVLFQSSTEQKTGIGTLGERTLHGVLKLYFEPDTARHEIKLENFVADIVRPDGIIEIQTRGFHKLRKKLETFLAVHPVTVVYPVARTKWLLWLDPQTGEITKKRRSPKTGRPFEIFHELYAIKPLLLRKNLRLCIVLLDMEEYRRLDGWSHDRKKGSTRFERIPVDIGEEIYISSLEDYKMLIPSGLPQPFTAKDFQKASGLNLKTARTALQILHYVGAAERTGKQGNAYLYETT